MTTSGTTTTCRAECPLNTVANLLTNRCEGCDGSTIASTGATNTRKCNPCSDANDVVIK